MQLVDIIEEKIKDYLASNHIELADEIYVSEIAWEIAMSSEVEEVIDNLIEEAIEACRKENK